MAIIFFIALVVASVSFTITVTSVFKWLRELVSSIHPKLEELIHCPYCLSHYIAALLIWLTDFIYPLTNSLLLNFLLTLFSVVGIVAILHYVMLRTYEPIAKITAYRELEKAKRKVK